MRALLAESSFDLTPFMPREGTWLGLGLGLGLGLVLLIGFLTVQLGYPCEDVVVG